VIEKDFDIPFLANLALREKQIQQNYRPVIAVHKGLPAARGPCSGAFCCLSSVRGLCRILFTRPMISAGSRWLIPLWAAARRY